MNEIKSELWVKELLEDVREIIQQNALEWCLVMHKIGMNDDTKQQWISIYKEQLTDLCVDMTKEANKVQHKLIETIEDLLQKSEALCKELNIKMPSYGSQRLGLFDEKKLLESKIHEFEATIHSRKSEFQELMTRLIDVCRCLGIEPQNLPQSLPSQADLFEFEEHIKSLEDEKRTRQQRFSELKCEIINIINEVKIKPSVEIEKVITSQDDSLFMVTKPNMKTLEIYYQSLIEQRDRTMLEISEIRDEIQSLWEMLLEDVQYRNEFLQTHTGKTVITLEALKLELKRCKDLKKANIKKFVKRLREELLSLWEKCRFTEQQRAEFQYFHNDLYSEDLLMLHEMEIDGLKKHYNENSETFRLLEKWEQLLAKMFELEERESAPNRLQNRGGRLLREEAERKALSKNLPKIEAQLIKLADEFEERTGRSFLSWGETVHQIIENHHKNQDMKKQLKLSTRKKQKDSTPGKSRLRSRPISSSRKNPEGRTPSPKTPIRKKSPTLAASTAKRKLKTLFTDTKRTKTENKAKQTQLLVPKLQVNDKTLAIRSRLSHERKNRLRKIRQLVSSIEDETSYDEDVKEYDDFQKAVPVGCRSTIFISPCSTLAVSHPLSPQAGQSATTTLAKSVQTPAI